jgi:xanthine dehydrogenase accessory factor
MLERRDRRRSVHGKEAAMNKRQLFVQLLEQPDRFIALATLIATNGSTYRRSGAAMLIASDGTTVGSVSGGCLEKSIAECARRLPECTATVIEYDTRSVEDRIWGTASGCNGALTILVARIDARLIDHVRSVVDALAIRRDILVETRLANAFALHRLLEAEDNSCTDALFIEHIEPPPRVLIFGSGEEGEIVAATVGHIGWDPVLVARDTYDLNIDERTMAVVMTHSFVTDIVIVDRLMRSNIRFIGILGSRGRIEEMLRHLPEDRAGRVHAPIGLDIGAETPAEIAIAIAAQMKAILTDRKGGFLSGNRNSMHGPIINDQVAKA